MNHGIIDVFAYQEALIMEGAFGLALLTMIWIGFRRWLQHKEKMARLIAEDTAERAAQYGAHAASVEARLKVVEQIVAQGAVPTVAQIDPLGSNPLPGPTLKRDEV